MQKKFYVLLALFIFSVTSALAQTNAGSIKGKVMDRDSKEPLPFVTVIVFLNGNTVNGGTTDIDGEYHIKPLEPGTYDISFQFVGYQPQTIKGVVVNSSKITMQNSEMLAGVELTTVEVFDYKVPLIDKDGGSSGGTVTREELRNMPSRSVAGLATTVAGATSTNGGISIRGARTGSTWVYIDGIKVRGSSALPKSAIEEISVITGGIPANIGDATGGVINVSLRNASANFTGGLEAISSGFKSGYKGVGLDRYGYNLIEGSLSGPLVFRKDEEGKKVRPLLGFFVSANYTDVLDNNPQFGGVYKIRDDYRQSLLDVPLRPARDEFGNINGVTYNANYLMEDAFEKNPTRINARDRAVNLVAKIDVNTSENVTLTFGGTGAYRKGHEFSRANSLMNWDNNQEATDFDWRAYARFSQRFRNAEGEEGAASTLKNVYYTVMVDYSKSYSLRQDETHKDKFFRYGHVGYFDIIQGNTYALQDNVHNVYTQTGFQDMNIFFTPSQYNPDLASITGQYFYGVETFGLNAFALPYIYDENGNLIRDRTDIFLADQNVIDIIGVGNPVASLDNVTQGNALRNGDIPLSTYNLWNYVGTQNNNYSVNDNNQFRVSGSGSADIGDHAVQLGFEYEQRKDAGFGVSPVGLWTIARQNANAHLGKIDTSMQTIVHRDGEYFVYYPTLVGDNQTEFDYQLREALRGNGQNVPEGEYLNVDNMDPDFLSIDMFSADELLNAGNSYITYYGYDHHGNKLKGRKPTIEDFFSQQYTLGNGNPYYSRGIGAFEPIYTSGFIMDKFAFDDLIFNVGVRVDRYDANQPVPKDPFIISEAFTAGEVSQVGNVSVTHPSNIGSDYVVYVDDIKNPTQIRGYRDGSTWYNADGQVISDPSTLFSNGKINPLLKVDPDAPLTSKAFKDYTPAVNIMPRIAFSFPISDEATFFAHYDVLTQRPLDAARFDPTDYLFMQNRDVLIANPALKPERTVDYALGFQQVLTKSSSIKIEAFYRELRNMIQVRKFVGAYPSSYRAFDNIDFGTVKGLTLTYDLRRTGNIWMKASYTLQFADGTGSSSQSQTALINAGLPNLRTVNPFNYDQRHRIIVTTDYRYGEGADYNGPVWFGKRIFENTGANLICNLGSGFPYTPQVYATPITGELSPSTEGSINGARLPWQFNVDLNLDRNISLSFGKEGAKRAANLNIYLWVANLLNTRNITGVYRYTGVYNDDGWLASNAAQNSIATKNDPASFQNYYRMFVDNPANLSNPRQIRLGVRFDF